MTSKLLSFLYNVATIFSILFRFLNRIFVPIFRKFIKFGSLLFNNCYFYFSQLYSNYTILFNWLLFILSAFCIYYFFVDITSIDIFQIFIFSIISFAIFMYISDNYQYSDNLFIRILQKFIIKFLKVSLIVYVLSLLNIGTFNTIYCSDRDGETSEEDDPNNKKLIPKKYKGKGKAEDLVNISYSSDDEADGKDEDEKYYKFYIKKSVFDYGIDKL